MKRAWFRILLLCLFVTVLAVLIPGPQAKADTVITTATLFINAPQADFCPDYAPFFPESSNFHSAGYHNTYYNNNVCWKDESKKLEVNADVFEIGHRYTVLIYLTPDDGYEFSEHVAATVNGNVAAATVNGDGLLAVSYTFPVLTVPIPSVSITIEAPEAGCGPDYGPVFPAGAHYYSDDYNSTYYSNDVRWNDEISGALAVGVDTFQAGHQYTVYFYLTPEKGYRFTEDTTAAVNGKSAAASLVGDGNGRLLVSYTFPALISYITSASVTITAPAVGASPDYNPVLPSGAHYYSNYDTNDIYYSNDVRWDDADSGPMEVFMKTFQAGHQYTVTICLTAKNGYCFADNATAKVNGKSVTASVLGTGQQLTVSYTFPTLVAKPTITTQPSSVTVAAGKKATFTVVAAGADNYQWQYKDAGGSWTNSGYSSAKTATLSFTTKAEMNGRQYRCKVTNSAGTTTSSAVTLSVKPGITTQPTSTTVAAGEKATFKVVATGATSYQWQYKDAGGSWTNSGYSSAKTATLSFPTKADMNGRQYRCKVTNSAGTTTSSTVTLTVNSKPVIATQPTSTTVAAGEKAVFKVAAAGASSYQWQYKDEGGSWTNSGYSSAKTATLSFTAKAEMNGRKYRCKVTNSAGTTTSSTVTLSVKPSITTQPKSATVTAGNKATFTVSASGTGLTYQWQYKDAGGSWTNSGYSSAKTATLSFPTTASMNGRQYRCKVTNSGGTTTSSAVTLTVNSKPAITSQPSNTTVTAGNKATFKVVATGAGSYQWQYKDAGGSWTDSGYSSAKTATLSFPAKANMNGRQYRCKVTNSAGTTTSNAATLTVK